MLVAWWLWPERETRQDAASTKRGLIKEVKPTVATIKVTEEKSQEVRSKAEKSTPTNIVWVTDRSYREILPDGKTVLFFVDDPNEVRKPALFKNGLNNFLTNYLVPGESVPETPVEFSDSEIMDAFMEKIEIAEDDDEDVSYKKESVALLRDQLREYIKDGKTIRDFLHDLQNRQNLEAEACTMARREILNSLADDDLAVAKETYRKINEYMKSKGLPNVRLPYKYMKMMEDAE